MKKYRIVLLLTIFLISFSPVIFAQEDPEGTGSEDATGGVAKEKIELEGLKFTGLPLIGGNSDDGAFYGVRAYGTFYEKGYEPFNFQAYAQYFATTLGREYHEFNVDKLKFLGSPLRVKFATGYDRLLNAPWYGIGNYQDIQRIKKIQSGKIPVNENTPAKRDLYQLTGDNIIKELEFIDKTWGSDVTLNEDFIANPNSSGSYNPGRRILQDKQDKYFRYDRIRRFFNLSTEDWISSDSNFKWFTGLRLQKVKIQSYKDDKEGDDFYPNSKTLIDLEKPLGYNATEKHRYVNGIRAAFVYDSRPRIREKNPNSGIFTDLHVEGVGKGTGSHYSYSRVTATWRQYIELLSSFWNPQGRELVVAYRIQGQQAFGDVPFFEAGNIYSQDESNEGLGGGRGLRGYGRNQFVDKVMGQFNSEVRFTAFSISALGGIDFVLLGFWDVGRVAPTISEMEARGLHKAGGGGLRLVWQRNTVVNISYGRSQYDSYAAFDFNHMF